MNPHVGLLTLLVFCCGGARATPMFYNITMDDGSGAEPELELLFPTSVSTRPPSNLVVTSVPGAPAFTNTITTTMIRLKDFVLSRVVDFLQENLLIVIVVTSLLICMVFIICCASAMSQKRKLEAHKLPPKPAKKPAANKPRGRRDSDELQERPRAVDHVKRVHVHGAASPKTYRMPSKALVGDRGRDVKSSPRPEARHYREEEEVVLRRERREEPRREEARREEARRDEMRREEARRDEMRREEARREEMRREELRREEPRYKGQLRHREEERYGPSSSYGNSPVVCTCHLKKSYH